MLSAEFDPMRQPSTICQNENPTTGTARERTGDQDRNDPEQAVEGKGRGGHRRVIAERLATDIG